MFQTSATIPTASAFVQARAIILPDAFQFLFTINNATIKRNTKDINKPTKTSPDTFARIQPRLSDWYLSLHNNLKHIRACRMQPLFGPVSLNSM